MVGCLGAAWVAVWGAVWGTIWGRIWGTIWGIILGGGLRRDETKPKNVNPSSGRATFSEGETKKKYQKRKSELPEGNV